jgi:hypothetical protein
VLSTQFIDESLLLVELSIILGIRLRLGESGTEVLHRG